MKKLRCALSTIYYHLNLKSKLIISYLVLIVIVAVGLVYIPYNNIYQSALNQNGNAYLEALRQAEKNISYGIDSAYIIGEQAQVNDDVQQILAVISKRELTVAEEIDYFTVLNKAVSNYSNTRNVLSTTYFVNGNPSFVTANPHVLHVSELAKEAAVDPILNSADRHLWLYGSDFTSIALQGPDEIVYFRKIMQLSNISNVLGYIMVELDAGFVVDILNGIDLPDGTAIVIRREGKLVNLIGQVPGNNDIVASYLETVPLDKQGISRYKSGSVAYYAISSSVANLNCDVSLIISEKNLGMRSVATRNFMILTAFAVSALAVVIAIYISDNITRRLTRVMALIRSAEKGEFKTESNIVGNDEYAQLFREFNSMSVKIKELIEEVYQAKISKQATEMKLLYAQINPHFLYNTLDIIQWSALRIGAEDIADMTGSLARELRLSLNEGRETITVDEEIESVTSYMHIINYRYKDAIKFSTHIQDGAGKIEITKMILQPLVENAIIHGIRLKHDKSGSIEIRVFCDLGYLFLEVKDDGIGIPPERLPTILDKESRGYGIKNVHQRIQVYYGKACGLSFANNEYGGCTATAMIKIDL